MPPMEMPLAAAGSLHPLGHPGVHITSSGPPRRCHSCIQVGASLVPGTSPQIQISEGTVWGQGVVPTQVPSASEGPRCRTTGMFGPRMGWGGEKIQL